MNKRFEELFKRLNNKYRLVILNDTSLEERLSFRLSRLNVYLAVSTLCVLVAMVTISLIFYTPLKEYIPGYQDVGMRRNVLQQWERIDATSESVAASGNYLDAIVAVMSGETSELLEYDEAAQLIADRNYDSIDLHSNSSEDSILRKEIEDADIYTLGSAQKERGMQLNDLFFTKPVDGIVADTFDLQKDHFGVDIVAREDEPIKAVLPGMVMLTEWSSETGHIIAIQHEYNLVSFYKHNSILLKKVGTFVNAGDAIAIIGGSGELSEGPHLHFELWYNRAPVDPLNYVIYEERGL